MTFLQHLGSVARKVFHIGTEVAVVAEPELDLAFPSFAGLVRDGIGLMGAAEGMMGAVSGTGPQKMAVFTTAFEPTLLKFLADNKIKPNKDQMAKFNETLVLLGNIFDAPSA